MEGPISFHKGETHLVAKDGLPKPITLLASAIEHGSEKQLEISGQFYLTNYRFIFRQSQQGNIFADFEEVTILLNSIYDIKRQAPTKFSMQSYPFFQHTFILEDKKLVDSVLSKIKSNTAPHQNLKKGFLIDYEATFPDSQKNEPKWRDYTQEFNRMGIAQQVQVWRDVNPPLGCYPRKIYVPRSVSTMTLDEAMGQRVGGYFPVVIYAKGDATLLTCRRPKYPAKMNEIPDLERIYKSKNPAMKEKPFLVIDTGKKAKLLTGNWQKTIFSEYPDEELNQYYSEVEAYLLNPDTLTKEKVQKGWTETIRKGIKIAQNIKDIILKGETVTIQGTARALSYMMVSS